MEELKVGIVTHYGVNNFGAVLQSKALADAIRFLCPGCTCRILDYDYKKRTTRPTIASVYQQKKGKGIAGIFKGIVHACIFAGIRLKSRRETPTLHFINEEMPLDSQVHLNKDKQLDWNAPPPYHALICGSDQIWAHWCLTPYFMLETAHSAAPVKIAYAPSFGNTSKLQTSQLEQLKKHLVHFSGISCRERDGAELLRNMLGKPCPVVPDPTMLHSRDYWLRLARKPHNFPYKEGQFVFTYRISFDMHAAKIAAHVAKLLKLPLVTCQLVEPHAFYSQMGPREFLWCIANAAHVVTSSFHGTVFSLIMGTPFHSVCSNAPQERLKTLLRHVNMENRYVSQIDEISCPPPASIPKETPDNLIMLRKRGLEYLSEQLHNVMHSQLHHS